MNNKFPADRIIYFSDAIFAIAITLLILEIKVPVPDDAEAMESLAFLRSAAPNIIGFLVSFIVTALYWRTHLSHARYIKFFDNKLLWLNIGLLLFVVVLPFSTACYSNYFGYNGPFIFYSLNLILIGLFNYLIISYALKHQNDDKNISHLESRLMRAKAIIAPLVWLASLLLVFFLPVVARLFFISIFIIQELVDRWFRKKMRIAEEGV